MAKPLKLKFSRVITSFNSCRSKDSSALPSNAVHSFLRHSPVKLHLPPPPPSSKPCHSSLKRHISSAFASISCRFRSRSPPSPPPPPPPEFHWEQEEKCHVVARIFDENTPRRKIYTSLVCSYHFPNNNNSHNSSKILLPPPPPNTERKRRRVRKKKKVTPRVIRISTSSADSEIFSSEGINNECKEEDIDNEETETLVSSTKTFSTDYDSSPEFSPHLEIISESPFNRIKYNRNKKKVKKGKRYVTRKVRNGCDQSSSSSSSSPARLSRFQWLIPCTVEGKVREGFAVVKKSEDPQEDFKRSMLEMIMEKQMFEVKDLEQLLQCFLSLNSRDHHGIIVEAFCDIWEALFCNAEYGVSSAVSVN
ncbi:transcription repressor OFP7 [Ricinus communis]|uniref:Transcription repressor n=1 Tax=Ricinus communis TaxID=3988 RepID=B9S6J0_RICCO|nr:transcription repressor OFP7 [Ricinus communis]EEF40880.1 conserved hypothetical protein [Ricinus communis]|eukprot:XP_002521609.1 transcription repressor OFP7 [Ricinus communis]